MKKILALLLILLISMDFTFAQKVKIGDLNFILNENDFTAMVTYKGNDVHSYLNKYKGVVEIPEYVTYEGKVYHVTEIGPNAFRNCGELTSIFLPTSLIRIGKDAFLGCVKLSTVYSSAKIGISLYTFSDSKNVKIYTQYDLPFSDFAKQYVENEINKWQQKSEFEKISDWQQRISLQREKKIEELLTEAEQKYINHWTQGVETSMQLGKYDAENEVFAITDSKYGTIYMSVPLNEAQQFKNNWDLKEIESKCKIQNNEIVLASVSVTMPYAKEYTYRNTDAVNYNLSEIEYNFEPIEINIPQSSSTTNIQRQHNITTTKVTAGLSQVDTNIPETDASNPNTFVIIFANEDYKNVASVPFAKNDGTIFQKYCQKTLGIPVTNIHYVENASYNDIRIQLAWLNDVCNAFDGKASLIIYYAGHGIPDESDKSAYLLPVDGDGRYVQSAYKLDDFFQKLGAMNTKSVTVFMDACFSGSKREDGMLTLARGVALKTRPGQPKGNMVVFSAAQGDETAFPNSNEQHGMFTYYLLKKLQETIGDVTLQELGEYITTNVRQQSIIKNGKSQTPTVTPSASVADTWQTWKLK